MAFSPNLTLYPTLQRAVILAGAVLIVVQVLPAQFARRDTANKGPRALGLLEIAANGKAHLTPVTIMYDGKFYDAGAYKATPVPMALERETVYEALKTGVSQGLFTVTSANRWNKTWIAEGTWKAAGSEPAPKKVAAPTKPAEEDLDKPPILRHADALHSNTPASAPTPQPAPTEASPPPTTASAPAPPGVVKPPATEEDKDRPILRRGPQPASAPIVTPLQVTSPAPATAAKPGAVQIIPAISDAGGPEPQSYTYNLKPEEEQTLRKKMLALAADAVCGREEQLATEATSTAPGTPRSALQAKRPPARLPQPIFGEVELRVFDLSNSNEPALVVTAKAQMPQRPGAPGKNIHYFVTLVARQEVDGELHKAFTNITDDLHLDVVPRMELIDAVDADGDGRGELLFRQVSGEGSAFVVYRVIGQQLWPLFQGTPQ